MIGFAVVTACLLDLDPVFDLDLVLTLRGVQASDPAILPAVSALSPSNPLLSVRRTHDEARRAYDRMAPWYEAVAGASEAPSRRRALALLAPRPGERVLEIGFGTGTLLLPLARAVGDGGEVVGVDLSPGMHARARSRLDRSRDGARVRLHEADATALPVAGGSVDAAIATFVLELFDTPEIPMVLAEIARVLRPGGRLVVAAMSDEGGCAPMRRLYGWAHERFERLADCRPIPAARLLREASFAVTAAEKRSMWGLQVDLVAATRADGPRAGDHA